MSRKETTGKPRLELLKRKALEEMAFIREFGIDKYENDVDWKDNPIEQYLGAALRHIYKHLDGEQHDGESGRLHLAHAMVDLMLAIELIEEVIGYIQFEVIAGTPMSQDELASVAPVKFAHDPSKAYRIRQDNGVGCPAPIREPQVHP